MRFRVGLLLAVLLNLSSTAWAETTSANAHPNIDLSPEQVVRIVIDALRDNNTETGDKGIATVWRFAAPSNKRFTGPFERFARMIDVAMQPVWLVTAGGDEIGYVFQLRRQSDGSYEGMWMTESVYPLAPKTEGTTI